LLAAVENPEEHLDLEVRVTGYSAFFTGLGEKTQQDIIDRTDH
jgi:formate C-acetyltransferase